MNTIKKIIIGLGSVIALILILIIYNDFIFNQENSIIQEILKEAGTTINKPPKEYSDEFAAKIINSLISPEEIQLISLPGARANKPVSLLFDHGENGGKLLSLHKNIDLNNSENIVLSIDRPDSFILRHKVQVGEYLEHMNLVRKESNNSQSPFKRTYLFTGYSGINKKENNQIIRGIIFYEGSMIELDFYGSTTDDLVKNFETVTWIRGSGTLLL